MCIRDSVYAEHEQQTHASRRALRKRWSSEKPLLGEVALLDLLMLLHFTVDNTDHHLQYTSQFIHLLQVYNAVEADKDRDSRFQLDDKYLDDMRAGALFHDMGKRCVLCMCARARVCVCVCVRARACVRSPSLARTRTHLPIRRASACAQPVAPRRERRQRGLHESRDGV